MVKHIYLAGFACFDVVYSYDAILQGTLDNTLIFLISIILALAEEVALNRGGAFIKDASCAHKHA